MAFRKKKFTGGKKRTGAKRRAWANKKGAMRKRMFNVHHFKFHVNLNDKGSANNVRWGTAGSANGGNITFALSDIANYTELTALYDRFRINKVVVNFIPRYSRNMMGLNYPDAEDGATSGDYFGRYLANPSRFGTCIDYDDSTNVATMDALREYSTAKITHCTQKQTRVLTPAVLTQLYESGVSSAYAPKFKQWVSTSDPTTPHYCLKWYLDAMNYDSSLIDPEGGFSGAYAYDVEAIYYISCRAVK